MPEITEPAWLSPEDRQTWVALATLLVWLPSALDTQLQRDAGMSHFEYGILSALSEAPERTLRMSELADYANASLSRLSRAVTRLERQLWVRRTTDPSDGRYTLAHLTELGWTKIAAAAPGHAETVSRLVFAPLTQAQTRQLREISGRITHAIRPEPGWVAPAAAKRT